MDNFTFSGDRCLEMVLFSSKDLISLKDQDVYICVGDQRISLKDWLTRLALNPSALDLLNRFPKVVQLVSSTSRQHEFENIMYIGGGAYSSVYSATHRLDAKKYALKILRNAHSNRTLKHAKDEVEVLARLDHPNIVRYFTCWIETDAVSTTMQPLVHPSVCISPASSEVSWASRTSSSRSKSSQFSSSLDDLEDVDESDEDKAEDLTLTTTDRTLALPPSDSCNRLVSCNSSRIPSKLSLFIQMELCQYTLEDWLIQRNSLLFSASSPNRPPIPADTSSTVPSPLDEAEGLMRSPPWSHLRRAPARWLFDQIAQGVAYLHARGILHRDLKPANVFLQGPPFRCISEIPCNCSSRSHEEQRTNDLISDDVSSKTDGKSSSSSFCYHNLHVKIGDFGLSTPLLTTGSKTNFPSTLTNTTTSNFKALPSPTSVPPPGSREIVLSSSSASPVLHTAFLTGNVGTLFYAAPEVLKSNRHGRSIYGFKADMYSLSVILFQLLYPCKTESELVFCMSQFQRAEEQGKESHNSLPRELQLLWPTEAALLARLMSSSPAIRPTAEELVSCLANTSEILASCNIAHSKQHYKPGQEQGDKEVTLTALLDRLLHRNRQLEEEVLRLRQQLIASAHISLSETRDDSTP